MQKYMRWSGLLVVLMLVLAACQADTGGEHRAPARTQSAARASEGTGGVADLRCRRVRLRGGRRGRSDRHRHRARDHRRRRVTSAWTASTAPRLPETCAPRSAGPRGRVGPPGRRLLRRGWHRRGPRARRRPEHRRRHRHQLLGRRHPVGRDPERRGRPAGLAVEHGAVADRRRTPMSRSTRAPRITTPCRALAMATFVCESPRPHHSRDHRRRLPVRGAAGGRSSPTASRRSAAGRSRPRRRSPSVTPTSPACWRTSRPTRPSSSTSRSSSPGVR